MTTYSLVLEVVTVVVTVAVTVVTVVTVGSHQAAISFLTINTPLRIKMSAAFEEMPLPIHSENVAPSVDGSAISEADSKAQGILDLQRKITNLITTVVVVVAISAIILELLSMYKNPKDVIYASGIIGLVVSLTVLFKQMILAMMDTLRAAHNQIRMEINRFMEENNELHRSVDELELEVTRLKRAEEDLARVTAGNNQSTMELVKAVKENEQYVNRIEQLTRMAFQEELLKTILRSDRNKDLKITAVEVRALVGRFKVKQGLHLNENRLMNALEEDGSVASVVRLIKDRTLWIEIGDE